MEVELSKEWTFGHSHHVSGRGMWDPRQDLAGGDERVVDRSYLEHPVYPEIIATGRRRQFEREQVLPGIDEDEPFSDSIVKAMQQYHAGHSHGPS